MNHHDEIDRLIYGSKVPKINTTNSSDPFALIALIGLYACAFAICFFIV